jgi:predicted O-methyltransferase YrrM
VVNLLRQTPTAAHMYALSSRAALTVCTINGLSHWCNAQNLRSLVIANKESSELSSYWPRIQQADNLYALTQHDALGLAKLHAARLIDLSAGGAPRNLPERDWWREWAKLDIRRAYQTCPRMPRSDHNSDFGTSREMYPLYQRIGKALGGRRLLEIGARLGHSLIALAADNPDLTGIDWIDNESYEKNSNRYCQENIVHFFARYRPERTLPEMRWWTTLERMPEAEQCPGRWDVIYIDGEHTYEGKLRDLNWALAMQPRVILVDDYYHMPCNREAIRDFSRDIGLPFWEMHTLRGLAVFDLTGGEAVGALERAGLAIQRAAFEAPEERPYAAVACVWNHAELLPYFLKHYTRLGYPRFFLAVYGGKSSPLWEECERLSEGYDVMLIEEFLTNPTGLTDAAVHMRIAAENVPPGQWWSPLDIDEFLEFSAPISEVIRTAGTANCVAGALLDRVSAGGELNPIQSARPLGEQFPWATQMTKNVVGSTQRKLMLVRDMAQIGGGHHAGLGERTHPTATGWVHHFKWSDSVQVRAVTHLHNHADHRENTSRVYQRFLDYYATHKKLDLSLPQMEPTWLGEKGMFQKGSGGIVV